jgi:hypothetical protein
MHTGVSAVQPESWVLPAALSMHRTQVSSPVSQTSAPAQSTVVSQPQAPLARQTSPLAFAVQSSLSRQPAQRFVPSLQNSPLLQPTPPAHSTQLFVAVLQTGVPPLQSVFSVHCTQVLLLLQAGVAGVSLQSLSLTQATHVSVVGLQTSFAPQSALVRQSTHFLRFVPLTLSVTQKKPAAQSPLTLHSPQTRLVVSQVS